jgi:putative heme-binding domain-containing protein
LTVAGAGRETLLNNILDPNREVAPKFEAWTLKLKNGEETSGLLVMEDQDSVSLRMASGVESRHNRADVMSLASTGRSLMPEGLDEGLTAEQMADLFHFIESLAQP